MQVRKPSTAQQDHGHYLAGSTPGGSHSRHRITRKAWSEILLTRPQSSPDGIRTRATALREQPPEDTFPQVKAHSVASPGVSAHSRCTANPAHAHIGGSDRKRYAATCNGVSRLRRPDGADSHSSPATVTAPRLRRRTGNLEDDRAARAVCPDVAAARAPNGLDPSTKASNSSRRQNGVFHFRNGSQEMRVRKPPIHEICSFE
jgi:hypothetical protein